MRAMHELGITIPFPSQTPEQMANALGIRPEDRVLDVGGGAAPLTRADVIVDRDLKGGVDRDGVDAPVDGRWLAGDIHALPFADRTFDFAYCCHVLEHTQNPARACEELMRVAQRGYIETPRRLTEMLHGHPTHRWLVDVVDGVLVFERRMFIESPLRNVMLAKLLTDPEVFQAYLIEQRHLTCVQFAWSGRFDYKVIEPPGWQKAFDYDNPRHAGWSHYYFALNLLANQAPTGYVHSHIQQACALLPNEGLPAALACGEALLDSNLPVAKEMLSVARQLGCEDTCLSEYEAMLTLPQARSAIPLPVRTEYGDDMPSVSVIIRSMDRPTISEALDSVALQTYPNIEVVVVNAKGEEHSKLGEWCGHFPLRIVDTGNVLRRSRAGNVGLSNARGDYLIFLDDDDWFMPEHISVLVNILRRNPDKKAAYSCVIGVNEQKEPIDNNYCQPFDRTLLLAGNYIPIHAVLFSRSIVDDGCCMDESLDLYEDWDFWLQVATYNDFIFVDNYSAYYRIGGQFGNGVRPDMTFARQISADLFEKWHTEWRREDFLNIMDRVRSLSLVEAERNILRAERDTIRTERDTARAERDRQVDNLNRIVAERNNHILNLEQIIEQTYMSSSWRITAPLRKLSLKAKNLSNLIKLLPSIFRISGGITKSVKKASRVFLREGWAGVKRRILFVGGDRNGTSDSKIRPDIALPEVDRNDYTEWLCRYDTLKDADRVKIQSNIADFQAKPLISVVMPVYNPPISFLDEAIQSVRGQLYPNWELCIADDASTDPAVRETLARHCREDHRIKVVYRDQNGHISRASNSALELAQGEFVALFDHDDLLAEHALYWVAEAINRHPDAGLIFSDEDKINESNRRYDPYFKCELNYELLLAQNMVSHLGVYRTEVVRDLGGFRVGFEGSQDYDLVLRVLEKLKPEQIVHIPHILYHWRAIAGSTALAAGEKNYAVEAGRKAVADHLKRSDINAEVMPAPEVPTLNRVRFSCPSPQPLVSLIIPTRDRADLLGMCLDSLIQRTTYENYEVIIVDNGSVEAATQQLFERLPKERFSILRDESPFNFSALNNKAAQLARGELLCLMNNDIEILTPDWLEEMVSFAVRPDIGCVGARLWYPDGSLQHGGILLGIGGVGNHAHYKVGRHNPGYFGRAFLHQSFSAVTAACLLVRRDVFNAVGGLDEQLAVAFNDVDFCLRVRDAGYRNVWTPYAEMNHHESASRGVENTPEKQIRFFNEVTFIQSRWSEKLLNDPAYSPNLALDYENFSYAWPPRIPAL